MQQLGKQIEREEMPKVNVEPEFQQVNPTAKEFEKRCVAWKYKEIWDPFWLAECVFSKDLGKVFG